MLGKTTLDEPVLTRPGARLAKTPGDAGESDPQVVALEPDVHVDFRNRFDLIRVLDSKWASTHTGEEVRVLLTKNELGADGAGDNMYPVPLDEMP